MFKSIEELKSFQKQLRPSSENYIYYYLNTIYQFHIELMYFSIIIKIAHEKY